MRTRTRPRPRAPWAVVAVLGLVAPACAGDGAPAATTAAAPGRAGVSGDVVVFAAASLEEAFTRAAAAFTARYPGAGVTFNFAASSALARQVAEGAPADVFAAADEATMNELVEAGRAGSAPRVFARNTLAVIVAEGNPEGVTGVADLARPDLVVVACDPDVPIGAYAQQAFDKAGVTVRPRSLEADVKAVVTKVLVGEADAGVVYATDVAAAGDRAQGVLIPEALNVVATYPIAAVEGAANPSGALAFVEFILSPEGQAILASYGFVAP